MEDVFFWIGYAFGLLISMVLMTASAWFIGSYICRHTALGASRGGKTIAVIVCGVAALLISVIYLHIPVGIYALFQWGIAKIQQSEAGV